MATTSPGSRFATAWLHSIKHSWKPSGSSRENTSPKVSWDGMPFPSSRKVRNHSSLLLPNISTWTHESAPQITAQMAIVMMSSNWCRLHRSILGSSKSPKYSIIDAPLPLSITPYDPPSHSLSHPKPSLSSITRLPWAEWAFCAGPAGDREHHPANLRSLVPGAFGTIGRALRISSRAAVSAISLWSAVSCQDHCKS